MLRMFRRAASSAQPIVEPAGITPAERRLIIYGLLFPLVVWLYMCAVNRAFPFDGTLFGFFSSVSVAYVFCIVPALLTGVAHNSFKEKGYRSILCIPVAVVTTPLMLSLFADEYRHAFAFAVAGMVGALCCWWASRIGQKPGGA